MTHEQELGLLGTPYYLSESHDGRILVPEITEASGIVSFSDNCDAGVEVEDGAESAEGGPEGAVRLCDVRREQGPFYDELVPYHERVKRLAPGG